VNFRRNNRRVELDESRELLTITPVRGPMLAIAGTILAAGGVAFAIAAAGDRHTEPLWALGGVWALVAVVFAVVAMLPAPRLRVELARGLVDLDGATHALGDCELTHQLVDQYAGRRRVQFWVVRLAVGGRNVKLLELATKDGDTAHNLVVGLQQVQGGDRAAGLETLRDTIECTPPAAGREVLMVLAMIVLPLVLFWLKGAFD
jgi:hypothetical protein